MKYLVGLISNNFKFYRYILLTGIDKLLAILSIIIVISLFKDKLLFNELEYIFSISAIVAIFLELGLSSYLFYGFKVTKDKTLFLDQFKTTYQVLGFYALILTFVSLIFGFFKSFVFYYVLVKAFSIIFINILKSYVRVTDNPEKIFWYSIPTHLISIIILSVFYFFNIKIDLFYFLLPNLILLIFLFFKKINLRFNVKPVIQQSLIFAWPIIFNSILYIILNNYIKIYAYNFFDSEEMYRISIIQRFSQVTFIIQVATVAFFSKKLYLQKDNHINWKGLFLYFFVLLFSVFLSILVTYLYIRFFTDTLFVFNLLELNYVLLFIYPALFCFNAFIELYFGRKNQNSKMLVSSFIGFLIFIILFALLNFGDDLLKLNIATFSAIITTLLIRLQFLLKWQK